MLIDGVLSVLGQFARVMTKVSAAYEAALMFMDWNCPNPALAICRSPYHRHVLFVISVSFTSLCPLLWGWI